MDIKAGDVVRLKSSAIRWTVGVIRDGAAECYHELDGCPRLVPLAALVKVEEAPGQSAAFDAAVKRA